MFRPGIRSLSAAALALAGTAVLAPSAQAAKPAPGWRVTLQLKPNVMLFDVAASDTRSAWVVGMICTDIRCHSTTPVSYHWNGTNWTPGGITPTQVDDLGAVSTSGPANTWAFGHKNHPTGNVARSVHWDGNNWATADLPHGGAFGPTINRSVTFGAKDTWAFGFFYPATNAASYIAHFTGKRWKQIPAPKNLQPGVITDAVARSGKDIWALVSRDEGCDVLHYDGKSWTIGKPPPNFEGTSMVVRSKNDIWLVGRRPASGGQPSQAGAMHFNGKTWSFVPVSPSAYFESVADDGKGGLWAVAVLPSELWHDVKGRWSNVTLAYIGKPEFVRLFHIPGGSTTLSIGTDQKGTAALVTGPF